MDGGAEGEDRRAGAEERQRHDLERSDQEEIDRVEAYGVEPVEPRRAVVGRVEAPHEGHLVHHAVERVLDEFPDHERQGELRNELIVAKQHEIIAKERAADIDKLSQLVGPEQDQHDARGEIGQGALQSQAYGQAGVTAADIKVAEVHDCFTIAEVMAYEDLGFCGKGEGGRYIRDRRPYVEGGGVAVNVDGGLKAKGHPIGATGVSMAYEIVRQLRSECGERQVPDADVGLTHNVGGIGQYTFVQVLRRD